MTWGETGGAWASGSRPKAERFRLYISVLGLDPGTHEQLSCRNYIDIDERPSPLPEGRGQVRGEPRLIL
ncbi:MAG: hypothetical protein CMH89_01330 [Oceanicaulis sp.]|nr:hypothetical protein [Oceanicaulis sp.]